MDTVPCDSGKKLQQRKLRAHRTPTLIPISHTNTNTYCRHKHECESSTHRWAYRPVQVFAVRSTQLRLPLPLFGGAAPEVMEAFFLSVRDFYMPTWLRASAFPIGTLVALATLNPSSTSAWMRQNW